MEISFEIEDGEIDKITNEILNEIAEFIFNKSQENLITLNTAVSGFVISDRGFLLKSGTLDMAGPVKKITYTANHADNVEWGTPAGTFVPFDDLKSWAMRKLRMDDKSAGKMAKNLQNKIMREGIPPKPYLRNAIDQGKQEYEK